MDISSARFPPGGGLETGGGNGNHRALGNRLSPNSKQQQRQQQQQPDAMECPFCGSTQWRSITGEWRRCPRDPNWWRKTTLCMCVRRGPGKSPGLGGTAGRSHCFVCSRMPTHYPCVYGVMVWCMFLTCLLPLLRPCPTVPLPRTDGSGAVAPGVL